MWPKWAEIGEAIVFFSALGGFVGSCGVGDRLARAF